MTEDHPTGGPVHPHPETQVESCQCGHPEDAHYDGETRCAACEECDGFITPSLLVLLGRIAAFEMAEDYDFACAWKDCPF